MFGKIAYNVYLLFIFITLPLAILITIEIVKVSKLSDEDEDDEPTVTIPKVVVAEYKANKYGHGETPTELLPVIEGPRCHQKLEKTTAIPVVEKTAVLPVIEEVEEVVTPPVKEVKEVKEKKVVPKRVPPRQTSMPPRKNTVKHNNSYKAKNKNRYVNVRTKKYRNSSDYYKKINTNNNSNKH